MNQGTAKVDIFRTNSDRRAFLHLLGELGGRFDVEVHAYVLMGNHYHLMVRSNSGLLSEAMQWIGTGYARYFNRRYRRVGSFFRGRFESRVVEDDRYRSWLPIYIHLNPVADGFVAMPEAWPWSSYRTVVGLDVSPSWLLRTEVGKGSSASDYAAMTRAYMRGPSANEGLRQCPESVWDWWRRSVARSGLTFESIEEAVMDGLGVTRNQLGNRGERHNLPRTLAIGIAADIAGIPRRTIAHRYDLTASGVASAIKRYRDVTAADSELASTFRLSA